MRSSASSQFAAGNVYREDPLPRDGSYTISSSDAWLLGEIDVRFTNRTSETVSLLNCNGDWALVLEKEVDGAWRRALTGVRLGCLSPPIEIRPGESRERVLRVIAGHRGTNNHPQFQVDEVGGTYRLVLGDAFWDYHHQGPPWGRTVPLEFRVSPPFELRVE
jgi:hypothetical protein